MSNRSVIQKNWPTQEQDMHAAEAIVAKYHDDVEGPLGMIEITFDEDKQEPIAIEMSEWMIEIINYFNKKYGRKKGQLITTKVMTRFLLKDETLH